MKWPSARITHIGLHVSDIEKIADLYVRALGMKVMRGAEGRFTALSFGYQHHHIALIRASQPRRAAFQAAGGHAFSADQTPWLELHRATVGQHDAGACLELATPHHDVAGQFGAPRDRA